MKVANDFHKRFSTEVKEEMAQLHNSVLQKRKRLFKEQFDVEFEG
jgi:hypothetical protein